MAMPNDSRTGLPLALPDEEKRHWLRLIRSENVGPQTFFRLINRFGGARAAIDNLGDIARRGGASRPPAIPEDAEIEREWRDGEGLGARLIARGDPDYPGLLTHIHSAPPLLWVRGETGILSRPFVAIVGSRNASATGRRIARDFAAALGAEGFAIVSGFARGIDTAAHEGSLETGTAAIFAGGLGSVYPPENAGLAERVWETGVLVSERAPSATPRGQDFPARNRIISGMALGVFVVEAASRSGTLITARFALEQGRDVFAAPGSLADPRAAGTNALIKSGATFVTEPADIADALRPMIDRPSWPGGIAEPGGTAFGPADGSPTAGDDAAPDGLGNRLVALMGVIETDIDLLTRESGAPAGAVQAALLELELAGRVVRTDRQGVRLQTP